ncbi:hypothetical protein ACTXT7_014508 [Hymenolepis weldensis]
MVIDFFCHKLESKDYKTITMSTLNQQRKVVEQLRLEAGIHRRPVSECIRDMIGFIEQYRDKDCLVNGFASKKDNPFQEKGDECQRTDTVLDDTDTIQQNADEHGYVRRIAQPLLFTSKCFLTNQPDLDLLGLEWLDELKLLK